MARDLSVCDRTLFKNNAHFSNSIMWFIFNLQRKINNKNLQQEYSICIYTCSFRINAMFVIFIIKAPTTWATRCEQEQTRKKDSLVLHMSLVY
jgi:hypothetical protein